MSEELGRNAVDAMSHPAVQKAAATWMIGTYFAKVFDAIPDMVAILSGLGGLIILYTIYRKNRAEERKFNAQSEILEARERRRKDEVELRHEKGDPCTRCTDVLDDEEKETA